MAHPVQTGHGARRDWVRAARPARMELLICAKHLARRECWEDGLLEVVQDLLGYGTVVAEG